MAYEYTGIVEEVLPVQTFNKGFRKQVVVIGEDVGFDGKYPSHNPFEFKGEHVGDLGGIRKGLRVKVTFSLDGRKWVDKNGDAKFFPTLSAFKIVSLSTADTSSAPVPVTPPGQIQEQVYDEDLPF